VERRAHFYRGTARRLTIGSGQGQGGGGAKAEVEVVAVVRQRVAQ
jgi:hypothetical protein